MTCTSCILRSTNDTNNITTQGDNIFPFQQQECTSQEMRLPLGKHNLITARMYVIGNETPFGKTEFNNTNIPLLGHTMSYLF